MDAVSARGRVRVMNKGLRMLSTQVYRARARTSSGRDIAPALIAWSDPRKSLPHRCGDVSTGFMVLTLAFATGLNISTLITGAVRSRQGLRSSACGGPEGG